MDRIVIDSSVWIDFFNKKNSSQIEIVKNLIIDNSITSQITLLPTVLQEVLQGIEDNKLYEIIKENLQGFHYIIYDSYDCAVDAAELYRFLQKKGITIRKANDCLIAALCINNKLSLLHNDRDFNNIAKHTSLKIYN